MIEIAAFLLVAAVGVRTLGYGVWTISGKNYTGGVFLVCFALVTVALGAYLLLFGGA